MSVADEFDVGEAPVAEDKLKALTESIEEAVALEEQAFQMEEDLKATRAALNSLKNGRIPDLMTEIGIGKTQVNGWEVDVKDFVSGSLPKDPEKRERALAWLKANEAEGLIKTEVKAAFGRSEHNLALSVAASIKEQGGDPEVSSGVHAATLQAFARERLKNGEPIDTESLGLYTGRVAKFKRLKG